MIPNWYIVIGTDPFKPETASIYVSNLFQSKIEAEKYIPRFATLFRKVEIFVRTIVNIPTI